MKLNFKKIASVLASTAMLSSTLALAAAANYPAPFVQNGNADVAVVYGSQPGAQFDLVAVADITQNLQAALAAQTATGGSTSTTASVSGGDYVTLAKPSDKVNLGNRVDSVYGATLTDVDLKVLLAKGVYSNDENTDYNYEQRITLGSGLVLNYFSDSDYENRKPSVGINLSSSSVVLNYSLDFTTDVESDISGGDLVDLETTNLKVLGKDYYISDFDNATNPTVTLLDTANSGIAKEGETVKVKVSEKDYEVSISFVDATNARLTVNGEVTNSLKKGGTYKLKDGVYVGIKDILYNSKDAGISSVEFSLGSGKLELRDGNTIKLNDNTIQEITSEIKRGSETSSKGKIDRINLVWTTNDRSFLTDSKELVMPGFQVIKFSATEFGKGGAAEVTEVSSGATDYMQLKTKIKGGDVTVPILYANSSGEFTGIGKSTSERIVTSNNLNAIFNHSAGDRTFVASWNNSNSHESYYLKFTSFENDNGINKTTLSSYEGGSWVDRCTKLSPSGTSTCTLGSLTLTINSISPHADKTVNFSTNAGGSLHNLFTATGLAVRLPYFAANTSQDPGAVNFSTSHNATVNLSSTTVAGHGWDTVRLAFQNEDRNGNVGTGTHFNVTIDDQSDGDVEVTTLTAGRSVLTDPVDSNHQFVRTYDDLGTLIERIGDSNAQRYAKITYNGGEAFSDIVLTTKGASVSSGGSATGGKVKDLGSVLVKDSEVASVATKNLIVVGGSCVNTLAKELLGGAGCGSDFEQKTKIGAGSFLIQTFSRTGGKVATLIAGYNEADTVAAGKYLTTQTVDTMAGAKYTGTGSTATKVTVTTA